MKNLAAHYLSLSARISWNRRRAYSNIRPPSDDVDVRLAASKGHKREAKRLGSVWPSMIRVQVMVVAGYSIREALPSVYSTIVPTDLHRDHYPSLSVEAVYYPLPPLSAQQLAV